MPVVKDAQGSHCSNSQFKKLAGNRVFEFEAFDHEVHEGIPAGVEEVFGEGGEIIEEGFACSQHFS